MALRDLDYRIEFDIDNRGIRDADREVDRLNRGLRTTDNEMDDINVGASNLNSGFMSISKILKGFVIAKGLSILGRGISMAKDEILDLIKTASDAQESLSKFNVVFGSLSKETTKWIETTSKQINRGRGDLRDYLGETQGVFFGFTNGSEKARKTTAEFSKQVVRLGIDLASFNNIADDDAIQRLQSGLSGNHDALRALGIALNENVLQMEMQRLGINGTFKDLDELTKMQVRFSASVHQSTTAIGDAERTSDSYENQVKALQGELQDMREELGQQLIPVATKFVHWIRENEDSIKKLAQSLIDLTEEGLKAFYDFISDKENLETFKEAVVDVADAIVRLARGIKDLNENPPKFELFSFLHMGRDVKELTKNIRDYQTRDYTVLTGGERPTPMPSRANGGEIKKGQLFQVNENGGEIQIADSNRMIIPHDLSKEMVKGGGGGNQVNINIPINIENNADVQDSMRQEIENFFGELLVKYGYVTI